MGSNWDTESRGWVSTSRAANTQGHRRLPLTRLGWLELEMEQETRGSQDCHRETGFCAARQGGLDKGVGCSVEELGRTRCREKPEWQSEGDERAGR